ncbi:MAG: signal peptidase I, partial [Blastochloris sp.]|nr:signal peptidase I [Blastochloris sp.]
QMPEGSDLSKVCALASCFIVANFNSCLKTLDSHPTEITEVPYFFIENCVIRTLLMSRILFIDLAWHGLISALWVLLIFNIYSCVRFFKSKYDRSYSIYLQSSLFFLLNLFTIFIVKNQSEYSTALVLGSSMEPAYSEFDIVMTKSARNTELERGDVVLFKLDNVVNYRGYVFKRIVAVGGDVCRFSPNGLYIEYDNGDDRTIEFGRSAGQNVGKEWKLGSDDLFVMGDNYQYALDSRHFWPC